MSGGRQGQGGTHDGVGVVEAAEEGGAVVRDEAGAPLVRDVEGRLDDEGEGDEFWLMGHGGRCGTRGIIIRKQAYTSI